jgi:hypothetical protein
MITEIVLNKNKALVSDYIIAVGQKHYQKLLKILHEDFEFEGTISLHTSNDFIKMLKDHTDNERTNIVLRNDIKAIFVDGNESYVIYDIVTDSKVGAVPCLEWIKIENEKILSTHLRFDSYTMRKLRDEVTKKNKDKTS